MKYEVKGKVVMVGDVVEIGNFTKREVVVETGDDKWENPVKFDVSGKQLEILDGINAGDYVTGRFYLSGKRDKKTPGRFWVNLRLVEISVESRSGAKPDPEPQKPTAPVETPTAGTPEDDDLPF